MHSVLPSRGGSACVSQPSVPGGSLWLFSADDDLTVRLRRYASRLLPDIARNYFNQASADGLPLSGITEAANRAGPTRK
jgi:hypothetical protein